MISEMKNITEFKEGATVIIRSLECGPDFKRRLAELGLFEGARIEISKNDGRNPLLVKVLDSKIVLDSVGAKNIYGEAV